MELPNEFKIKTKPTDVWAEYEMCKNYNYGTDIDLYDKVKLHERFFTGDQWLGVKAPDIDKPVLNFMERTVMYEVALIVSNDIAASVKRLTDPESEESQAISSYMQDEIERIIEERNIKSKFRENIRDCAVDGDTAGYVFYDADKDRIDYEILENTSVLFGNPSVADVQTQPYIILEKLKDLREVRLFAFRNNIQGWDTIQADDQRSYRESDQPVGYGRNTVTVLQKFWRDDDTGTIWFTECTMGLTLREPTDTKQVLYPIAWMNWQKVKESYHGKSLIGGMIPNQIAVNRLWAGALWHLRQQAFPKVFYDRSKIPEWSNMPGATYAVAPGALEQTIATSFEGPKLDQDVKEIVEKTISMTRDFMGVNDTVLGNINPSNTSAIIAVQKSTAAPLEMQRLAFYQFVEDIVRIIADQIVQYYGTRTVKITREETDEMGNKLKAEADYEIDFNALTYDELRLGVDIGEASYWSELTQLQTMDGLFQKGIITDALLYLDGIPDKYIPNKQRIIDALKEQQEMQQQAQVTGTENVWQDPSMQQVQNAENHVDQVEAQMNEMSAL